MELDALKESWRKLNFESLDGIDNSSSSFLKDKSVLSSRLITKKLFWISLIEFAIWGFIGIGFQILFKDFTPQSFLEFKPLILLEKLNYLALGLFVLSFLISYKSIDVMSNVKLLIHRLLNTKRIVNIYIYYNLAIFVISFMTSFIWELYNNDELKVLLQDKEGFIYVVIIIFGTTLTLAFATIIYKLYRLVYGSIIINFQKHLKNLRKLDD